MKVITYGTFDLLHYGHVRLLERAKKLGRYLIVGITSDDYDKSRGKINVKQTLIERIEAVRGTGLADEIIVEEYSGQKIDDIIRLDVDIFAIGSDWTGQFDYLKPYCQVVYLKRTEGISSTELRNREQSVQLGMVGETEFLNRFYAEAEYVNGMEICGVCADNTGKFTERIRNLPCVTSEYHELLRCVDAVYIISHPMEHYRQIKEALEKGKHVLCESPIAMCPEQLDELEAIARSQGCVLVEALRTAYSTAYSRLLLLVKSGIIGKVRSVDATCTSLRKGDYSDSSILKKTWNSICMWGPVAMLPVFQILGTNYVKKCIVSNLAADIMDSGVRYDTFSKVDFIYGDAVASIKVGKGVKSEGELIISGTEGYAYVPAPWWKTDYFEVRFENQENNRRYFYQLDGEGIRYELVAFIQAIGKGKNARFISEDVSRSIITVIDDFNQGVDQVLIGMNGGEGKMTYNGTYFGGGVIPACKKVFSPCGLICGRAV